MMVPFLSTGRRNISLKETVMNTHMFDVGKGAADPLRPQAAGWVERLHWNIAFIEGGTRYACQHLGVRT
jgi:hypothetical protein